MAAELDDPLDVLLNKCFYEINRRSVQQLPINSGLASACTHGMLLNTSSWNTNQTYLLNFRSDSSTFPFSFYSKRVKTQIFI